MYAQRKRYGLDSADEAVEELNRLTGRIRKLELNYDVEMAYLMHPNGTNVELRVPMYCITSVLWLAVNTAFEAQGK